MKFYNPYQFIPFSAPNLDDLKPYKKIQEGETPYIRHDRWDEDSYSGRILCKLTTISPTANLFYLIQVVVSKELSLHWTNHETTRIVISET